MKKFRTLLYIGMGLVSFPCMSQTSVHVAGNSVLVEKLDVSRSGSNLLVDMDVNLNELELPSNIRFVFTPYVKGMDSIRKLPPMVVNGRRQQISYKRYAHRYFPENTTSIRRKNGTEQTVHYTGVLPYEEWMDNSNVVLAEDLCGCGGDLLAQNSSVLGRRRNYLSAYVRPSCEAVKERHREGRAFLDFPVDKVTLYPDYRNNPRELDSIFRTIKMVRDDRNTSITRIRIHGYASPESPYDHNAYLAENRARTLKDYVCRLTELDESLFEVEYTAEDWVGLRSFVASSNLEHRSEILELIDRDMDADSKEWLIKSQYPEDYKFMVETWYPALRHSDYEVTYVVRAFNVEEAKELLYTKPQLLSLEEMFMVAQTYEPGSREFNDVFGIAVRMFPDDPVANLNVASVLINEGDYVRAEACLARADALPEALVARGVLAARQGRYDEARRCFIQARDAGVPEAAENLRLLDME